MWNVEPLQMKGLEDFQKAISHPPHTPRQTKHKTMSSDSFPLFAHMGDTVCGEGNRQTTLFLRI